LSAKHLAYDDSLEDLSPTARNILQAALAILLDEGLAGLTLSRVAARAGANKASIAYHFGNKDGLIAALFDVFFHEENRQLIDMAHSLPLGPERIEVALAHERRIITSREYLRALVELLPTALRTEATRRRLDELYKGYRRTVGITLDAESEEEYRKLAPLAHLYIALVDGLSIQYAINPDDEAIDATLNLVKQIMRRYVEEEL
jgi:AcrR family transcriptional regulator